MKINQIIILLLFVLNIFCESNYIYGIPLSQQDEYKNNNENPINVFKYK